jgi:hypothetical protein
MNREAARFRPRLEALERRELPAVTYLVLDFSHDRGGGSLLRSFQSAGFSDGTYPRFLDLDGNRTINTNDVAVAARAIANRVALHFRVYRPLGVRVVFGDATANSDFLQRWLDYGRRTPGVHVAALAFGGFRGDAWGRAPLASPGENVEGVGRVYSDGHARFYRNRVLNRRTVPSRDFINAVAATASHELGHMMGLLHVPGISYHLMTPGTRDHNRAFFPDASFRTERGAQNAHRELIRSFRGQATVHASIGAFRDSPGHDTRAADRVFADLAADRPTRRD